MPGGDALSSATARSRKAPLAGRRSEPSSSALATHETPVRDSHQSSGAPYSGRNSALAGHLRPAISSRTIDASVLPCNGSVSCCWCAVVCLPPIVVCTKVATSARRAEVCASPAGTAVRVAFTGRSVSRRPAARRHRSSRHAPPSPRAVPADLTPRCEHTTRGGRREERRGKRREREAQSIDRSR